ncbi:MAG: hypothetical protein ACK55Z_23630, partial [bacterium]
ITYRHTVSHIYVYKSVHNRCVCVRARARTMRTQKMVNNTTGNVSEASHNWLTTVRCTAELYHHCPH